MHSLRHGGEIHLTAEEHRRIFIVEDDEVIAGAIAEELARWDLDVAAARDLRCVAEEFARLSPDLVLMDVALPCFNGFYWCGEIRKTSNVPIIFISSHGENMDIVMAMNMGGDDYIVKPFSMDVLTAKINAMLRRAYGQEKRLSVAGAALTDDGCLIRGDARVELTKNEQRILQALIDGRGRAVSRDRLMLKLWNSDCFIDDNTLTVNVNRLRRKLEEFGLPDVIETRKGEGYIITGDKLY